MKQRAAAILFSHKYLLLLPLIIILPLTTLLALRPRPKEWQSVAEVWVEQQQPTTAAAALGWTPAANQVGVITQLIRTTSFSRGVLQKTPLAPMLANRQTADAAMLYFWRSVTVTSADPNFMTIIVTTQDPNLSWKIAQGVVDNYQSFLLNRGQTTTDAALTAADNELKQAQQSLIDARTQLANYLAAHPELSGSAPAAGNSGGTIALAADRDVTLALLQQQVQDATSTYTGARQHYLDLQAGAVAGKQDQSLDFSVIDKPELPVTPVHIKLLSRLQLPLIGLVLALLLGAGVGGWLVLTDHTILGAYDVDLAFDLPVLAEVAELPSRGRRSGKRAGDYVRQQLAAPARYAS